MLCNKQYGAVIQIFSVWHLFRHGGVPIWADRHVMSQLTRCYWREKRHERTAAPESDIITMWRYAAAAAAASRPGQFQLGLQLRSVLGKWNRDRLVSVDSPLCWTGHVQDVNDLYVVCFFNKCNKLACAAQQSSCFVLFFFDESFILR